MARGTLARFRANAAAIHNRAVYEIPGFLRRVVEGAPDTSAHEPEKLLSEQRA